MKQLALILAPIVLAGGLLARHVAGQSLAEVARQAREERDKKEAKGQKPVRTYTNTDVEKLTGGKVSSVSTTDAGEGTAAEGGSERAASSVGGEMTDVAGGSEGGEEKGEEYWKQRMNDARLTQSRAQERIELLQLQARNVYGNFVAVDDPGQKALLQTQLQKLNADIEKAQQEAAEAANALKDLKEEGRKAGALPGWLR